MTPFTPIQFFAPGTPMGEPRARAVNRGGFTRMYTPGNADSWKKEFVHVARNFIPPAPIEGPLHVLCVFYFPRPENHTGTGRNAGKLKDWAPRFYTSKPDADNCEKLIWDQLTKLGFWRDDAQICENFTRKLYPNAVEKPGCYVLIKRP